MLHEKRSKVLQIRLSPQEWEDLHNFVSVNYGTKFTVSQVVRWLVLNFIQGE